MDRLTGTFQVIAGSIVFSKKLPQLPRVSCQHVACANFLQRLFTVAAVDLYGQTRSRKSLAAADYLRQHKAFAGFPKVCVEIQACIQHTRWPRRHRCYLKRGIRLHLFPSFLSTLLQAYWQPQAASPPVPLLGLRSPRYPPSLAPCHPGILEAISA